MRRLATAAERDPSGKALSEGLAVLREAGLPVEALGLGVGHWRVREQDPAVGRQLVLAALEAERRRRRATTWRPSGCTRTSRPSRPFATSSSPLSSARSAAPRSELARVRSPAPSWNGAVGVVMR